MKKILFAASAIAIAMGMASCSDYFLDLNPTDQQTEANFYKTPEEFEAAANSTYSFYGFGDVSETVNGTKYTSSYYDMLDVNSDILAGINPVAQYRAQNEAYKSGRPSTGVNGLLFSWLHCSAANGDAKRNV